MAQDDDYFSRRRRERDRQEERQGERRDEPGRDGADGDPSSQSGENTGLTDLSKKIDELMRRAEPLMEQVNSLYNQYAAGVEQRPPVERRKNLDQLMVSIQMMSKPTQAQQFRANNLVANFNLYKQRWERLLKGIESGEIKRNLGPGSKRKAG